MLIFLLIAFANLVIESILLIKNKKYKEIVIFIIFTVATSVFGILVINDLLERSFVEILLNLFNVKY
jgi:uncharacterized membrane protein YfcA